MKKPLSMTPSAIVAREWRAKNPGYNAAACAKWQKENPAKVAAARARTKALRARKSGRGQMAFAGLFKGAAGKPARSAQP